MADGRHYLEPESVARKASATIKTIEPCNNLCPFLGRDAGAIILNGNRHRVSFLRRSNSYCRLATGILERVVDQVRGRARQKIFVAERRWFAIDIG
jgi:hypothetical protein